MRLWPFQTKSHINVSDVKAAPPPNRDVERQRDIVGLQLQRESIMTTVIAKQIQETLAAGVLLELRGGRN